MSDDFCKRLAAANASPGRTDELMVTLTRAARVNGVSAAVLKRNIAWIIEGGPISSETLKASLLESTPEGVFDPSCTDPDSPGHWSHLGAEYDGTECANCGRSRVLIYTEVCRRICEKCNWDQDLEQYPFDHNRIG
jgi:hypothetical protein